jgi:hypothetical protein
MSLSKKYYLTDTDEARMLAHFLLTPYDAVAIRRRERGVVWSEIKDQTPGLRPDDYRGNHPREYEMRKLETEIRLLELALRTIKPIEVGLNCIHLDRKQKSDVVHRLHQVYDLYATQLTRCGQPLAGPILTESLPILVFDTAITRDWIPYPLVRPKTGGKREFLEDEYVPSLHQRVPDIELVELFADYRVTKGYGAWFRGLLEPRIVFWRANGIVAARWKRGRPQTIPDERKAAAAKLKASGGSNKQAAVLIYDTKYPSPQQVKNVPSHLKAFKKKLLKQSGSSIRTSSKPPKMRG